MVMTPLEKMYLLFLFLAYSALFVLMFGFMVKMLKKSRKLETDVELLREVLGQDEGPEPPTAPVSPTVGTRTLH